MTNLEAIREALAHGGMLAGLCLVGFLQGMVLAAVFWRRESGDRVANRLLAALFVVASLHVGETFFWVTGLLARFPYLGVVSYPLVYLVGPFYWFYVRRTLEPGFRPGRRQWPHLVPALFVLATTIPGYFLPAEVKIPYYEAIARRDPLPVGPWMITYTALNVVQNLGYLIASSRRVARRRGEARARTADAAAERGLATMQRIGWAYGAYIVFHFGIFLLITTVGFYHIAIDTAWLLAAVIFVQVHGYAAIARPENVAGTWWRIGEETDSRYERSRLDADRTRQIRESLEALMREDELFREGSLTLSGVADRLGVTPHHLSQVLNRSLERTFFDYVNDYRVEAAKRQLEAAGNRATVLEIALEAGFNHKSTFHEAFRARTGTTPSEWRRRNRSAA